jgi:hypothetical protein
MDISQHKPGMQFDSHGASAVAVSISFATIAAFTVAVRLVTRWRIVNNLGADDLVISASMVRALRLTLQGEPYLRLTTSIGTAGFNSYVIPYM